MRPVRIDGDERGDAAGGQFNVTVNDFRGNSPLKECY
jgi:hypothetical protein